MDLRKRLSQYDGSRARARSERGARGDGPGDGTGPAASDRADLEEAQLSALGLTPRPAAAGTVWSCDDDSPASGAAPPVDELAALARFFGGVGAAAAHEPPASADILFVDTETTGLAGGTGSLAFLIGCAWWEGPRLRTRQLFLPGPGREGPLLAALAELAAPFRAVVTYNGRGFDLPLLRTRALLGRRPDPLGHLASWDLLFAARRLWGRRLPDCKQPTVESHVCGFARDPDDVPGALIPPLYFRWLRHGEAEPLAGVLAHNRRDLCGMAEILGHAACRAGQLTAPDAHAAALPWEDAWSAARVCEGWGDRHRAAAWIAAALAGGSARGEAVHADAVRLLKRARDWRAVESALEAALATCGDRPWVHREAAILYEHRLGQLQRARHHAERLGDPIRLARLARKLERAGLGVDAPELLSAFEAPPASDAPAPESPVARDAPDAPRRPGKRRRGAPLWEVEP